MFSKLTECLSLLIFPIIITLGIGIPTYFNSNLLLVIFLTSMFIVYSIHLGFQHNFISPRISKTLNIIICIEILLILPILVDTLIVRAPIENTYSVEERARVENYLQKQVDSLNSQIISFPNDEEIQEILQNNLNTTFTLIYFSECGAEKGYVKALELNKRKIYITNADIHPVVKIYYIAHELSHLDGSKNEALTSYRACLKLINTDNILLKLSGYNAMLSTMINNDIDYYDFSQYVCDFVLGGYNG